MKNTIQDLFMALIRHSGESGKTCAQNFSIIQNSACASAPVVVHTEIGSASTRITVYRPVSVKMYSAGSNETRRFPFPSNGLAFTNGTGKAGDIPYQYAAAEISNNELSRDNGAFMRLLIDSMEQYARALAASL